VPTVAREFLVLLAAAALVAGLVTSLLVPPLARLAYAFGMVDRPDARKPNVRGLPRLGGVAMVAGIAIACAMGAVFRWPVWSRVIPREELAALAIGTLLVFLVGFVDDLIGASPWQKLLVEILAAWLVVRVGWSFHVLRLPVVGEVDFGIWGGIVSIVWVVGVTNAINLIDGLDGLAGGVAAIIAGSLLAYSVFQHNQATAILFAAVVGACVGFLWHNWEPARIFMGDGGALTLGYLFGALSLHSSIKAPAAVAILVPILALGLPVIDTLLVMMVRFAEGRGRPIAGRVARMFRADRSHLHHTLENLVRRRRRIVVVLYGTVLLFCAGALAVALSGAGDLGLALLAVEFIVVFAMRRFGMAAEARRLALDQRAEARRVFPWFRESLREPSGETPAAPPAGDEITRGS
jgi:UDP-GlcNAc:undecaprenyl-phosphate GlcNAc-1-phosphate transferase